MGENKGSKFYTLKGYQLKNDIYNNKRDQKNVAPFVVTNDLSFTLIHISTSAVLAVVPPEP